MKPSTLDENERATASVDSIYEQTLELLRSQHSALIHESTVLSILLVTMVGFAVDRQALGITLAALVVYPAKLLTLYHWQDRSEALLNFAKQIEPETARLSEAIGDINGGYVERTYHRRLVWIVAAFHLAVVIFIWLGTDWSFAGAG